MILITAGVAGADQATARRAYDKGVVAYKLQRYDDALAMFTRAYEEMQDASLLYNIAQCQRLLGKNREAIRSYRLYLADGGVDEPTRVQIQKLIAEAEEADRAHPSAPAPSSAAAPVAAPTLSVPAAVDRPTPWYRSGLGWGLVGGGVAVLAVGGGLFAHGNDLDHQVVTASSLAQAQQLGEDRDHFRAAGVALFAVGGAALVSGAVVFAVVGARSRSVTRSAVTASSRAN